MVADIINARSCLAFCLHGGCARTTAAEVWKQAKAEYKHLSPSLAFRSEFWIPVVPAWCHLPAIWHGAAPCCRISQTWVRSECGTEKESPSDTSISCRTNVGKQAELELPICLATAELNRAKPLDFCFPGLVRRAVLQWLPNGGAA